MIDGHIDLPEMARFFYKNNISAFDLNHETVSSYMSLFLGTEAVR